MPEAGSDMGTCTLIVNEHTEEVCNRPGEAEILVRNPFGLFATTLCSVHRRMHVEFYASTAELHRLPKLPESCATEQRDGLNHRRPSVWVETHTDRPPNC
jgi:hypothetical protein